MSVWVIFGTLVVVCATSLLVFRRRPLGTSSRVVLAVVALALILAEPYRKGELGMDDLVLAVMVALVLAAGILRLHKSQSESNAAK
jgi:uncharacterized membrane protein